MQNCSCTGCVVTLLPLILVAAVSVCAIVLSLAQRDAAFQEKFDTLRDDAEVCCKLRRAICLCAASYCTLYTLSVLVICMCQRRLLCDGMPYTDNCTVSI
jgi:hypothetical protein